VWRHEARDFTTWLENNIDVLNDTLDLSLVSVEREQSAGTFSVDLVGEDESGHIVIIENQLEKSDHDHLGKVITYLTSLEARAAVWIVAEPRPEHVRAIAWLNESSSASFYLVKVEAIKIGDSPAAPLLTLITGPSLEAKEAGDTKKELAARQIMRKKFWTGLLARAKGRTKLHAGTSPRYSSELGTSAGLPTGLYLSYRIRQHDGGVELYFYRESSEENLELIRRMKEHKQEIEESFGEPLEWDEREGSRACAIRWSTPVAGWREEEESWPQAQDQMIDAMIRLERALRPHLGDL
jgi:hypothetical protein